MPRERHAALFAELARVLRPGGLLRLAFHTNTGNVIYQFKGGKVVRAWLEADRLGVLQAIGAVPAAFGPRPR